MQHSGDIAQVSLKEWDKKFNLNTVRWLKNRALKKQFGIRSEVTLNSHKDWLHNSNHIQKFGILFMGDHVGNLNLIENKTEQSVYLQIFIGELNLRGKGIGKSALKLGLNKSFFEFNANRVWLHTLESNRRVMNFYKSAGFTLEGCERQAHKVSEQEFEDKLIWSILREEFIN